MRLIPFLFIVTLLALTGLLYIRLAPMQVGRWHVDPLTATRPATPNAYLLRDADGDAPAARFDVPLPQVAAALEQVAAAAPRTVTLAGSAEGGFVTYVQRSRLMGYPDAISIRLTHEDGTTRVSVFSRSRYGRSDLGVNQARVTRWMAALAARLGS